MLRSMTGFGRGAAEDYQVRVCCEVKSVNHRYFEFSARLPRACGFLEDGLKKLCAAAAARGKLDLSLQLEFLGTNELEVAVNESAVLAYQNAFALLEEKFGIANDVTAKSILKLPELFTLQKKALDEDALRSVAEQAASAALANFTQMREEEGAKLRADILINKAAILALVACIEERSPQTVLSYNEKLKSRMAELLGGAAIDEQRLLQEAALFADKIAVAEETVRLRAHLEQLEAFLCAEEPVGRKLDFLVQEINREANTIGSKANDIEIARAVVEMKSCVEKIREQVQNIE